MLPELGQILLILALLVALLQGLLPLIGAQRGRADWMAVARPAAYVQLGLVAGAFTVLTHAFLVNDFSVGYVAGHSHSQLPEIYRYTAVWSAHEGSLLLWVLILALWTATVAARSYTLPATLSARLLGVLGLMILGFLTLIVLTSNPFTRLLPAVPEGHDLNPLLQDPGLIVHPPLLYAGYIGFAVPFAFTVAVLLEGRMDPTWLRWSRPWTQVAWALLTLGIALGSWWAYYELGWGGWWFWDPVENASFMPWLGGVALIHSQAITDKRGSFTQWTLLLAIMAFALSLLGTFLVRSGVLTSVHTFASDPVRGMFLLVFMLTLIGGALLLYAWRAPLLTPITMDRRQRFAPLSRETLLLINNLLLICACAMVLLGTLYPLLADALGLGQLSVGPPYFGPLFTLLMTPLVVLLPFGPFTRWQREHFSPLLSQLAPWAALAVAAAALAGIATPQHRWTTMLSVTAAAWVLLGTMRFIWLHWHTTRSLPNPSTLGMVLAHTGIGVFLVGALLAETLSLQCEIALSPGQTFTLDHITLHFDRLVQHQGPNYLSDSAQLSLLRDGRPLGTLTTEKRHYVSGGSVTTEAGIRPGVFGDVYVSLGASLDDGRWAIQAHYKPFVRWIWLGAALMALGGLIAAADRRFRHLPESSHV
ncbi:MAG TPA: heme lyase CcmF/NrfE family subunit [Xylella sp.]